MKSGVLNVYKEQNMTSHDVVARVRRLFSTRKVGHAGTLDPQATGVLPVLIGSAAKACDLMPEDRKIYRATLSFGASFDTEDVWGAKTGESPLRPTCSDLERCVASFVGAYDQIPPMISAVKVNGKKLYEYARLGQTVERKPRRVFVYSFTLLSFDGERAELRAEVSRGTYIRTLLTDLCGKMGVLGAMSALEREKSGIFTLESAVSLSELEEMNGEEREALLLPTEDLFLSYPALHLPAFYDRLVANGCAVLTEKLSLSGTVGDRFRLCRDDAFYALASIVEENGKKKLKKIKNFAPDGEM